MVERTNVAPLILSFSPWEKGRLNSARSVQHRPLSQGERDRVRGVTFVRSATMHLTTHIK
jgi:hypothetical protein